MPPKTRNQSPRPGSAKRSKSPKPKAKSSTTMSAAGGKSPKKTSTTSKANRPGSPRSPTRSASPMKITANSKKSPKTVTNTAAVPASKSSSLTDSARVLRTFYLAGATALTLVGILFHFVIPGLDSVPDSASCSLLHREGLFKWSFGKIFLSGGSGSSPNIGGSGSPELYPTLLSCGNDYRSVNGEWPLLLGFCLLYVTMQSFVIPGTGVLSVLSGALFPFWVAEIAVALCASTGATVSYFFSLLLGSAFIDHFKLNDKLENLKKQVDQSGTNSGFFSLFSFLVALRTTPVPNLLINVGAPHAGISPLTFFFSTLLGLVPLNSCHICSGRALAEAGKLEKGPLTVVAGVGSVCLVGLFLAMKWKKKEE